MNKLIRNLTGLEHWLAESQTRQYLDYIGVEFSQPSLSFLRKIIRNTYAIIPFQNLTMLNRPKVPPSSESIVHDMLSGLGGLCTTINPFIAALLHNLGFDVSLLMVSMERPNCHIGLRVDLDDQCYWVDLGNGFPYLEPLPLKDGATYHHPKFSYMLELQQGGWAVRQSVLLSKDTKINQIFVNKARHYDAFKLMRKRHYTEKDYGPFLSGIRINRWTSDSVFLLRDDMAWDHTGRQKVDLDTAIEWLHSNFSQVSNRLSPMLKSGWGKVL